LAGSGVPFARSRTPDDPATARCVPPIAAAGVNARHYSNPSAGVNRRARPMLKRCGRCNTPKPASEFSRYGRGTDLRSTCRACCSARDAARAAANIAAGLCRTCKRGQIDSPGNKCRQCWFSHVAATRLGSRKHGPAVAALFARQEGRCALTGSALRIEPGRRTWDSASLDHRVPISRGGTNDVGNTQWVTWQVNNAKANYGDRELLAMARALMRVAGELPANDVAPLSLVDVVTSRRWLVPGPDGSPVMSPTSEAVAAA
jgi:hypothetical protein